MKIEFKKLDELFQVLLELDKIIKTDSNEKIDSIVSAISNIDRTELNKESQNRIALEVRNAVFEIYKYTLESINNEIGLCYAETITSTTEDLTIKGYTINTDQNLTINGNNKGVYLY